jgi:hypothetical protein
MPLLSDLRGFVRLSSGLQRFLREPISAGDARARVIRQLQSRDSTFLELVNHAVFQNPGSPYLRLFRNAGCQPEDVRQLVLKEGLEGTLEKLFRAGIYVTFEEFKGFAPAVRGSQTFNFRDTDFDNPLIKKHFGSTSGGTRGRPTRVIIDLEHIAESAPHWAIWFAEHDILESPLVYYTPTHAAICNGILRCAGFGKQLDKWFEIAKMTTWRDRMVAGSVQYVVRRALKIPHPEFVPIDQAWRVGDYLAGLASRGTRPCLNTYPSAAVRICRGMEKRGVNLDGCTFLLRGEALTPSRRTSIEAAGAKAVQTYGFSEGGTVGSQCTHPARTDDVHLFEDVFAVIQRQRPLAEKASVSSLLLTGLRRACPKVLLNTEIGDHGVIETRPCDCLFGKLGYRRHLHSVRGFDKVTSEGMTFFGPDVVRLLEEVLPHRFGGSITDYQLVEEEDSQGLCRYALLVSPEVGTLDERALVADFLEELGKTRRYYGFKANLWAQAGTLKVRRAHPVATSRGKILPFRALRV